MELEDYKIMTSRIFPSGFEQKELAELAVYSRGRAQSMIDGIKRSLRLEIAFALLFAIFDGYLILRSENASIQLFAKGMLVFCASYIFYIYKLMKYIKFHYLITYNIREQLQRYIIILRKFIKLYFQLTTIMMPLIFLLVLLSIYGSAGHTNSSSNFSFTINGIWIYLCVASLWSFIMYFFTKWYVKKLYGSHLNNMTLLLNELQEAK